MSVDTPQAKRHVYELIEQLGPDQVAAVLQLLRVMVEPCQQQEDVEPLSEDDHRAFAETREYLRNNPESGVSFEQFASDCGFSTDQVLGHQD